MENEERILELENIVLGLYYAQKSGGIDPQTERQIGELRKRLKNNG